MTHPLLSAFNDELEKIALSSGLKRRAADLAYGQSNRLFHAARTSPAEDFSGLITAKHRRSSQGANFTHGIGASTEKDRGTARAVSGLEKKYAPKLRA